MKEFFSQKTIQVLVTFVVVLFTIISLIILPFPVHAAYSAPNIPGKLWATGHDVDYHCSVGDSNACHYLQIAVNFARNGSSKPILVFDHGTEVATSIGNVFGADAPMLTTADPRATTFVFPPLVSSNGVLLYSAIIVASDITCGGCDNNDAIGGTPDSDAINAHAADIATFFQDGGGILALAGADNSSAYYSFLPAAVHVSPTVVTPSSGSPGSFVLTSLGKSLGLSNTDVNCCITHNSFLLPSSGSRLQVAETDSAGNAETLIVNSTVTQQNVYWSGYGAYSPDPSQLYSQIVGSWKVPRIKTCGQHEGSIESTWVGLGGLGAGAPLEQIGTLSYCQSGKLTYVAFYESLYPNPPTYLTNIPIKGGDKISATVTYQGTNQYLLTLRVNGGTLYSFPAAVPSMYSAFSARNAAECIEEAPPQADTGIPNLLEDFGSITFSDCLLVRNGQSLSINSGPIVNVYQLVSLNPDKHLLATLGSLDANKPNTDSSFTIYWKAPN